MVLTRLSLIRLASSQNQSSPLSSVDESPAQMQTKSGKVGERKGTPKDFPALKATALVLTLIEPGIAASNPLT